MKKDQNYWVIRLLIVLWLAFLANVAISQDIQRPYKTDEFKSMRSLLFELYNNDAYQCQVLTKEYKSKGIKSLMVYSGKGRTYLVLKTVSNKTLAYRPTVTELIYLSKDITYLESMKRLRL